MSSIDLRQHKIITLADVEQAARAGARELLLRADAVLTQDAADAASRYGMAIGGRTSASLPSGDGQWDALFRSPEAEAVKAEICAIGKKLWMRSYVDGNGGNISHRLTPEAVICTPTLCSKYDLTPADLCLVDLQGNQLAGIRPRTSEILMHLEIYKAVPEAKAVVHCHPPHATAYAITARVPPTCVIPEYEVFIGRTALSPYETPGTQKFAETVIPFVKSHNSVLLANHGIVCWADSVTHAEWYAEVLDTYCWTLMNANQLGVPLSHIPSDKATDLLAIKKKLGLPDSRLDDPSCSVCEIQDRPGSISMPPSQCAVDVSEKFSPEAEAIIEAVTRAVL
ncbi:MAG: class II aldolase/adducin family protein, partial [Acidobacteria bacterium]|nr:class II aldolase/adducin family protein [Acidobacteriota bacterium]